MQRPNATETVQPRTNNVNEWQFPLVTARPDFFPSNPSFETRNRFQQLSNLPAGNDERHQSYADAVATEYDQARNFQTRREETYQQRNLNPRKKVCIVGDSMLKQIKRQNINRNVRDTNVHVKTFPGATVEDMQSYIKPTVNTKPDEVIVHCGTNDLRNEEAEQIARKIIRIAKDVQLNGIKATVSALITRADSPDLEDKRMAVNRVLREMLRETGIGLINHDNIIERHLNRWGLHLNPYGADMITKNYKRYLIN